MHFPDFLEPYRAAGQKLLQADAVKGLVFSGPTYQIEVRDPELSDPLWVFLQFDEQEEIKDLFCSCEESTEKGACSHMAAACLQVLEKDLRPPHARFEASFWNRLFWHMLEKTRHPRITYEQDTIEAFTEYGELLFRVKGNSGFSELLHKKQEETEETSIKFSTLSDDELENWRKGCPSFRLRYELSPLSDIAKWFFLKQEAQDAKVKVSVTFLPSNAIPKAIEVHYKDLVLEAPIDIVPLIPTLNTIQANLRLLDSGELSIKSIDFNEKTGEFSVHTSPKKVQGTPFGDYRFIESVGFLSQHEAKVDVERLFIEAPSHLKPYLPLEDVPKELSYAIYFDDKKVLHVEAYLAKEHDLEHIFLFGDYAYIGNKFVKLAPRKFDTLHLQVPKNKLTAFLMANRLWLSGFDGFFVHVAKLEEQILYEIDLPGNLTFRSVLQKLPAQQKKCFELGDWLYVEGDGFYVKHFTEENPPLALNRQIPSHLVADYVRHHLELLQAVPGFFAADNPIKGIGLEIKLKKRGVIEILPIYEWFHNEDSARALFYDQFVFVRDKGFYHLPPNFRPQKLFREIAVTDASGWNDFFEKLLPKLKEEYSCTVDPRLERAEDLALTVSPQGQAKAQRLSDFELDVSWRGKKGQIGMKDMLAAKKHEVRYLPTPAGVVDLTEDRFRWLDTVKERTKELYLQPADFLRVTAYDTIHVETQGVQSRETFRMLLERLLVQKPQTSADYATLSCDLRPYQQHGVDWLWFLYQNELSGLLCDDMGVGKTHQAMGLMAAVQSAQEKEGKKSLFIVVCPTSLIFHWQDKLERFLPHFKVKCFVGNFRTLEDFPGDFDLLLVSYGILRNESKEIAKYAFDAAFFDELQIAKNHVSQIHSALLKIKAKLKVGLTGTPIENHLRELKALFDIVLPGYMPFDADYREFFMRPIERGDNPKRRELLSRFVRPFILRRRKCDVLPELPEKTEELAFATLAPEQKSLYSTVSKQQALPLIQQLQEEGSSIPYMHIFAVISALKQICNHPAAYLKDVANFEAYESGKWDAFVELIEEAMESEQKVVVFSQFLAMLDIIELFLQKSGIGYAQIRGQTKNRGDEVMRFHNDPNCKVFLGSLQAAGLGIDLTPASIVIHYDRWWNAARENQATDRVHRIGQLRGVQVFKLLTKNTVEERIDQLISRKASLLEDVVFFDDHQIVKRLSRKEIISLLQGLPEE